MHHPQMYLPENIPRCSFSWISDHFAQKDKFKHACFTLAIYDRSKNYISNQDIIGYADQIKKIKSIFAFP